MFSYPNFLGLHFRAGGALIKEDHIRLDTGLIENARWQTQNGVQVGSFQQLFADDLARAALKQYIIRHNDCRFAGSL